MTNELQRIEPTPEMHAVSIANELLSEADVTADFITTQLNRMGLMIFGQDKCNPQLIFDLYGTGGLKLIRLLGILKQALAEYDADKYRVTPAPKNFVPTETKVLLTPKE